MKKLLAVVVVALSFAACGPAETDACKKYITCQTAVNSTVGSSLDATYGPSGTCWKSTQAVADACDATCKSATSALATANPNETACK
jgi:hypothetical protein